MGVEQKRVQLVFGVALEMDCPTERAAYLKAACGADTGTLARVQSLLRAHDEADSILPPPPIDVCQTLPDEIGTEGPGTVIGRYKLLQEIGEGGFGAVYMAAQQQPVDRKVALKIIKLGMDTRQVIARFEAERQALAMMDHPNIAKVLDAGATDAGRPYFVMELVRGVPITEYCDKNDLTTTERLELFIEVCRAVQHAHQKGIIHRDIKPTNVMVTLRDGQPMPKVIDFGIAKATQRRLTEKTLYTDYHQFIGTPQYMSPEQATMSDRDVDTRTDIYSLGVLLYELLVGSTPFPPEELREIGYDEICRIIREREPPTPSRRLSTVGEAAAMEVSQHHQTQPAALCRLLRGDLDWIVMKALEKDRTRRYETANDFAADVERYLKNEPVEARHPSAAYKFRKFARRNRTMLTTAAMVASALLLGTVVSVVLAVSATIERNKAEDARQREFAARRRSEDLRYVADMTRAEQARRDRDWRLVRRLLREHHPSADGIDRRGWEWRYLWRACHDTVPTLRHDHLVYKFAISPDGTMLVSGDTAGNLNVWDVSTRQKLSSPWAHRGQVIDVEFSPDGSLLASSGFDNRVRLWRIDAGKRALISEGFLEGDNPVGKWQVVTFSHDGKFVAVGGREDKIRIWRLSSREWVAEIPEVPGEVARALAFHPQGEALAAHAGTDVVVWPLPYDRDKPPRVFPGYDNIAWVGLAFSPNGRLLAANWKRNGVDLYSVADRQRVQRLEPMRALSVAFSPDSKTIAVGQWDKGVSIWDTTSGEKLHEFEGHSSGVCCVRFTSDGRRLASSSFDKTIRLWPLDQDGTVHKPRGVLTHHSRPVETVAFSPDGTWLATAERFTLEPDRKVLLWDAKTWHVAKEFSGSNCAFSRDSRILAITGAAADVRLWDLHARQDLPPLPHAGRLAFSPNGNLAVVGGKKMRLWAPYERRLLVEYSSSQMPPNTIMNIGFSADGKTLAARDYCGDIGLFDAQTLSILQHRPERLELFGPSTAFSPDSPYWATPDYDHTVKVWDLCDGKLELYQTLGDHTDSALCAAFSPNGILAVGCANGSVRLWDSSTWKERVTLKCHDKAVLAVCFSPDGSTLVTGSDDATVRIHRAVSPEEVIEAERRGVDPLSVD